MPLHGRTSREDALDMLKEAREAMQEAEALVSTQKPTKRAQGQAFRLLSRVEATCATLKIALDPW